MIVSKKRFDREVAERVAAYDRLDMVLAENERLLKLLRLAVGRKPKEAIPSSSGPVAETVPKLPSVIKAAIENTFPGDTQLYSLNYTYAMSQQKRWEDEAEQVASEIIEGRQV